MVLGVRCRVVEVLATMELAAALPLATTARRVDAVSVGEGDHRSLPLMLARCNRRSRHAAPGATSVAARRGKFSRG